MTNKKFSIVIVSINLFFIPVIAFASWWNPMTWFNKKVEVQKLIPSKLESRDENPFPIPEIKQEDLSNLKNSTTSKVISKVIKRNDSSVLIKENRPILIKNETVVKTGASALETAKFIELENLKKEWRESRAAGTGYYSIPVGQYASYDQILGVRTMADKYYSKKIEILTDEYLRIKYADNPVMQQQIINNSELRNISNNISNRTDELNSKLDSVNSKQEKMQKCLNDLTDGLPGYVCN